MGPPLGLPCSLCWIFSLLSDVAEMTWCHISGLDVHLAQFRGPTVIKLGFQWGIYHLRKKLQINLSLQKPGAGPGV